MGEGVFTSAVGWGGEGRAEAEADGVGLAVGGPWVGGVGGGFFKPRWVGGGWVWAEGEADGVGDGGGASEPVLHPIRIQARIIPRISSLFIS